MTDRFSLFDKLYKAIEQAGGWHYQGIDMLDASISPLYLSLLGLYNEQSAGAAKTGSITAVSKITERIKDKIGRTINNKKQQKEIDISAPNYKKATYLFFPVEPTHLRQMVPVLKEMRSRDFDFLIITNRLLIYQQLRDLGFSPVLVAYPVKSNERTINSLVGTSRVEQLKQLLGEYLDRGLAERYFKNIKDILDHYTIPFIDQFRDMLADIDPVAIVVGYDITLEGRIMTLLARQSNIRTVCIQHGSISGEPLDHHHIVDRFLLYGEAAREYLLVHGLPPSAGIVTGAPYLDGKNTGNEKSKELKKLLRIDEHKPYVLIALSGPGHSTSLAHFKKVVLRLLEVSRDHPGYQFVAKLHRKDKLDNYKDLIAQVPGHKLQIIEDKKYAYDIFAWLHDCDLLITGTSTVAQEAMLMEVPVMTIDLMNEYHDVDFIDRGCTIHITEEEKIGNAVQAVLEEKGAYIEVQQQAGAYAAHFFYKLDNHAAKRCVVAITESELKRA